MVERLKAAIEKARESREEGREPSPRTRVETPRPSPSGGGLWAALPEIVPDTAKLRTRRIIAHDRSDPAHVAFDVLRTRILKSLREHGWRRLAVTAPTKGCGKSFVCLNLAFSLARQADVRVLLVDLDLRAPTLASLLDLTDVGSIKGFLHGETPPERHLRRIGDKLAIAANAKPLRDSAESLGDPTVAAALNRTIAALEVDVVIYDLPPMLTGDDVIAGLPLFDCVLMVAAAGETRPLDVERVERLLPESANFLGVVLNKSRSDRTESYGASYG
jgi:Mrp family chromosome partitioning ATPase